MSRTPRVALSSSVAGLRRALCAAGRGACARRCWPRRRARRRPRRASTPAPRRLVEAIRAQSGGLGGIEDFLHAYSLSTKRGPRADGAGRGAAARAGCRDRRPADRGQARGRRLVAPRGEVERAAGLGLGLDARHHGAHHPAGRNAGEHPRQPRQAARPAGACAPRRGRRCGCSARISCSGRPSRRRWRAPARTASSAIPSTCWARARAPPPTPSAISSLRATPSRRSARAPATRALPDAAGHFGEAVGAASALRGDLARARARRVDAARAGAGAAGEAARPQLHRRCRGGRPARTVARRDRRGAGRSLARRLGRLRARGAGLSEARRRGDRLARATRRMRSTAG